MNNLPKTILHVDMNSYFATLLQQENPALRGRPIGVIKDVGRTCIIAASKEAKAMGVRTGSYLKDAKEVCPNILCVPAQFERYLDATRRLKKIFHDVSPDVFIYSLDEAFIDITDCLTYIYKDPVAVAKKIQHTIFQELGEWVTCNVGISHNRLLAKLASGIAKKGNILHITPENKDVFLASAPFSEICGIGYRLEKKLKVLGVTNPYQIRFYSEEQLLPIFGPFWAKELLRIAYGEDSHVLSLIDDQPSHMKSVGRSITGFKLCKDEELKKMVILNLIEEVTYKTRRMNLAGRQVWIGLYGHEHGWSAHQTNKQYIQHTSEMFDLLYHQLYLSAKPQFPVIKFAVRLSLMKKVNETPLSLFDPWQQKENLSHSLDAITEKYGLFTVKPGSLLSHDIIRPEVTGFLGDRQYYGL
ncbi:MAG: hypothetical protein ABI425_00470 [Patescibacteria group bacterium]